MCSNDPGPGVTKGARIVPTVWRLRHETATCEAATTRWDSRDLEGTTMHIAPRTLGRAALGIGSAAAATVVVARTLAPTATQPRAAVSGDVDDWDLREAQDAVTRAAPTWSSDAVIDVAQAVVQADMDRWDTEEVVKAVVDNAPRDWSDSDQATVAAAAVRADMNRWDIDSLLDGVRHAPSDWSTADEARVTAVAVAHDKDRWNLESAIRWGSYASGGTVAEVAKAISELTGSSSSGGSSWDYDHALREVQSASDGWSSADEALVAQAAVAGDQDSYDIRAVVDEVESRAPGSWGSSQEALVAAAALQHDRDRWDVSSVLDGIRSAPSNWSSTGQARVSAAALEHDQDGWDVRSAISDSRYESSDPARQVVHAIAELAEG